MSAPFIPAASARPRPIHPVVDASTAKVMCAFVLSTAESKITASIHSFIQKNKKLLGFVCLGKFYVRKQERRNIATKMSSQNTKQ
tara:strand:- start:347 stop:601 length:255 start_codon:yes stop_codon:yes gene_type:complete